MPCVFQRDFPADRSERVCRDEVTPGCEWVINGEGIATRKWDGTACAVIEGALYARFDAKRGKTPPAGALPCDPMPDPITGHWPHWVKVEQQPEFKWHRMAWSYRSAFPVGTPDGTYELVSPMINGNKERVSEHLLFRHGMHKLDDAPRSHSGLKEYLSRLDAEGIVFHHPDGRMAKIRRSDFCMAWPPEGLDVMKR